MTTLREHREDMTSDERARHDSAFAAHRVHSPGDRIDADSPLEKEQRLNDSLRNATAFEKAAMVTFLPWFQDWCAQIPEYSRDLESMNLNDQMQTIVAMQFWEMAQERLEELGLPVPPYGTTSDPASPPTSNLKP